MMHVACARCGAAVPIGDADFPAVYPTLHGELDSSCEPECWAVCNEKCGEELIAQKPPIVKGEPDGFFFYEARHG